ncbi:MAG: Fic family protein [Candidatus Electryonea clarkiae]|nr:Fic family protein [Candidatus Electryonea clarkiae]MDP8288313.1 Fic family protein [Candidatus Electryonea clarkiae]
MFENSSENSNLKPVGYAELISRYELDVIPNWHSSMVAASGTHRINTTGGVVEEVYPSKYWPGENFGDHLEFALKYDGVNLEILSALFKTVTETEVLDYIKSKPTGMYARRVWFLYELLTENILPIDDLKKLKYVDVLDPNHYYTINPTHKIQRYCVNDNLLGDRAFCPIIRRTERLDRFEKADLPKRVQQVISDYSMQQLKRALSYLYTKETKSSFEIEQVKPSSSRTERFVALLHLAEKEDFCNKSRFIELQNRIVDPRFRESDYRTSQNYVGETVTWQNEMIHYVCPKPDDIAALMEGLVTAHERMENGGISPVIHAAAIAYGFVFLHPFEDGNGRIHRFLIHNILARQGFTNPEIMLPISASMLNNLHEYDTSLEKFSRDIISLVDYSLDEVGKMIVHNDSVQWYRFIDMTPQAEALCWFIEQAIDTELVNELEFLDKYDETKMALQEIIDMPDHKIDLFIRLCVQNNSKLSAKKRLSHFDFLSDDELVMMEHVIHSTFDQT